MTIAASDPAMLAQRAEALSATLHELAPTPWRAVLGGDGPELLDAHGRVLATLPATAFSSKIVSILADAPELIEAVVADNRELEAHLDDVARQYGDRVADQVQMTEAHITAGGQSSRFETTGQEGREFLLNTLLQMGQLLDKHNGPNYLEFDLARGRLQPINVMLRRTHRPTAHDLRQKSDGERDKALALLEAARTQLRELESAAADGGDITAAITGLRQALATPDAEWDF